MVYDYDVVVIGGGAGGLTAAPLAAHLGARTALVEAAKLGGDCLWSGCVPSKALLKVSKVAHTVRTARTFGIDVGLDPSISMPRVMASVRHAMRGVEELDSSQGLARLGITVLFGTARFSDAHTLDVAGQPIRARRFIISTGSWPLVPAVPGLREAPQTITNEQLFDVNELPARMVVIGGGYIGVEMAQALARLDSQVTIVEQRARLLEGEDEEVTAILTEVLRNDGIEILLQAQVERVINKGASADVHLRYNGRSEVLSAERILVATGAAPRTDGLGLDAAGVHCDDQGAIIVDQYLRTSQPHIYAIGDVNGRYPFSHIAAYEASVAVPNALLPIKTKATYPAVAWSIFTDPELAHLGLTEAEARARHKHIVVVRLPLQESDRAHAEHATAGLIKLIATPIWGKIVGVHIVGESAGEAIHSWVVAVRHGLTVHDIVRTTHVYPTISTANQQAAVEFYRSSPFWYGMQRIAQHIIPQVSRLI